MNLKLYWSRGAPAPDYAISVAFDIVPGRAIPMN